MITKLDAHRTHANFAFLVTTAILILLSANPARAQLKSIGLNFSGTSFGQSGFIPPDTMGTVGPNHIVEMINGRYRVYNKATGSQLEDRSLNSFWNTYGTGYSGSFAFDPRVQYDPHAERFYATSVDNAGGANNVLFAVSDSSNPLDGWTGFQIDSDSGNEQWADFPQMGFSKDTVTISANMFGISGSGGGFEINMVVLPKSDLLAATPTVGSATLLEDQYANTGFEFSLQPAIDLDDSSRPPRLLTTDSSGSSQVGLVQIDGAPSSPSINNVADVTGLTSYADPPLANQPGAKQDLDSGGDRTRSAVTLIDGSYYGIHGASVDGRAALRWYKIDADTLSLESEGVIADDTLDLIYGSIAANEFGDIVVGMTGSSESQYASAYAVVGNTDELGSVTFGDLQLLKAGVDDYERLDGSSRNRWGDYSATVLDPSDPYTFWTFQEWVSGDNAWSVQITEINVVPEPGTLLLLLCGTVAALATRRNRGRSLQ